MNLHSLILMAGLAPALFETAAVLLLVDPFLDRRARGLRRNSPFGRLEGIIQQLAEAFQDRFLVGSL